MIFHKVNYFKFEKKSWKVTVNGFKSNYVQVKSY